MFEKDTSWLNDVIPNQQKTIKALILQSCRDIKITVGIPLSD